MGGGKNLFYLLIQIQVWLSVLPISFSATVRYLPGFQGPLPFELETGYVGVGETEDVQLFYYFIRSQKNPEEDPLLLWLTGGPGCSALSALLFEIGPLLLVAEEYNGSLPSLGWNAHSWTKAANIIYVDSPVGAGFSYSKSSHGYQTGDFKSSEYLYQFLTKWMIGHPEFVENPFYVAGDSYSGKTVPLVTEVISDGNEAGSELLINIKGYILGNPGTDPVLDNNKRVPFAHGMGLISSELYESLKRSCGENYTEVDPNNVKCLKDLESFHKCISGLNTAHILEPFCPYDSPKPEEGVGDRRSLGLHHKEFFDPQPSNSIVGCRSYAYYLSQYWTNDDSVLNALHMRKGTIGRWLRCHRDLPYSYDVQSSIPYHMSLSRKGYRSLVYSGDHDMMVPFVATEAWINSLNYSIIDEWRPWVVDGQIGGYTKTYSNRMTFATVKGAGHTAPEFKPKEVFAMFKRWISEEPL